MRFMSQHLPSCDHRGLLHLLVLEGKVVKDAVNKPRQVPWICQYTRRAYMQDGQSWRRHRIIMVETSDKAWELKQQLYSRMVHEHPQSIVIDDALWKTRLS